MTKGTRKVIKLQRTFKELEFMKSVREDTRGNVHACPACVCVSVSVCTRTRACVYRLEANLVTILQGNITVTFGASLLRNRSNLHF